MIRNNSATICRLSISPLIPGPKHFFIHSVGIIEFWRKRVTHKMKERKKQLECFPFLKKIIANVAVWQKRYEMKYISFIWIIWFMAFATDRAQLYKCVFWLRTFLSWKWIYGTDSGTACAEHCLRLVTCGQRNEAHLVSLLKYWSRNAEKKHKSEWFPWTSFSIKVKRTAFSRPFFVWNTISFSWSKWKQWTGKEKIEEGGKYVINQ